MIFTKHGQRFRVDECGGIWFEVTDRPELCWGERMHGGERWLRCLGIDI